MDNDNPFGSFDFPPMPQYNGGFVISPLKSGLGWVGVNWVNTSLFDSHPHEDIWCLTGCEEWTNLLLVTPVARCLYTNTNGDDVADVQVMVIFILHVFIMKWQLHLQTSGQTNAELLARLQLVLTLFESLWCCLQLIAT